MLKSAIIRACYMGIMFVANLILANLLLPLHYGYLTIMILNASAFSIFSGFGTDSIVLHSVVNKKWSQAQALTFTWNSLILQVVLFFLLEFISLHYYEKAFLSRGELHFLLPESLFFLGLMLTDKYVTLLYTNQKAFATNMALLISATTYFIVLIVLKNYVNLSNASFLLIFSLQSIFQGLFLVSIYHFRNTTKFEKIGLKTTLVALRLSIIVMITNFIQFFAYRIDYYIIQKFYTESEVGIFSQSNKIANLMWIIPNIMALLLITKFSSLSDTQRHYIFIIAFIKNIGLALCTLFVGYIIFSFVLNPVYYAGLQAFYIMLPGFFCWASVIYFGAYFSFLGKFKYNLIASSFCLAVILLADLIFIPKYAINGAAISNSIAYTATFCIYLFLYFKTSATKISELFLFRSSDFLLLINSLK